MVDVNHQERTLKIKLVYYGPAVGGKTTNLKVLHESALGVRRGQFVSVNSAQDRTILLDLLPIGHALEIVLPEIPDADVPHGPKHLFSALAARQEPLQ